MKDQRTLVAEPVSEGLARQIGRMAEDAARGYRGGLAKAERAKGSPGFGDAFRALLDELGYDPADLLQKFRREVYGKFLGFDCPDLSSLTIPAVQVGFKWIVPVVAIHAEAPIEAAFQACKRQFKAWKYWDGLLDVAVSTHDRNPCASSYVIRLRDRIEADEELRGLSANTLRERGIAGITLYERLVLEAWYYVETGGHLDLENYTLCAGSRGAGGDVPHVCWRGVGDSLDVGWCRAGGARSGLRTRQVVS